MDERIEVLIRELAEKFGTTAEHLWEVLILQARITCACDPVACQQNRKEYSIEELTKAVQEGSIRTVKYEECISWDEAMKLLPETRNEEA